MTYFQNEFHKIKIDTFNDCNAYKDDGYNLCHKPAHYKHNNKDLTNDRWNYENTYLCIKHYKELLKGEK